MHRAPRPTFLLLVLLAISLCQPGLVAGTGPVTPPSPPGHAVPPGSIVLPNGRILPAQPPGLMGKSEMAAEWLAHAGDHVTFAPGAKPSPLDSTSVVLTTAGPSAGGADLIPLAPTDGRGAEATLTASLPNRLKKQVFGFLPYWMLDASDLHWMRYDLVSTIAYFGVAANANGTLNQTGSTWGGWTSSTMTNVTNAAHARGDKVVLTVTMMAWDSASAGAQATLLTSSTYRARLVSSIVATVQACDLAAQLLHRLRPPAEGGARQRRVALLVSHRVHDRRRGDVGHWL